MIKRTTIELDQELLEEVKNALGLPTTRATVEESLRRTKASIKDEQRELAERQREYFKLLAEHGDLDVLASDEMWR
jgi:Arc/MetJ family transcription regulator